MVPAPDLGLYRLSDGELTTVAAAGVLNALEFEDVRVSDEPTADLVAASGGGNYWLAKHENRLDIPSLRRTRQGRPATGRGWAGLVQNNQYTVRAVREVPMIPVILALLLLCGALLGGWWREGH